MGIDEKLRAVVAGFATESQDLVDTVIRRLLELEGASSDKAVGLDDAWESAARGLHTLKGGAGSLGMGDLATLAHKMEDLLAPYRRIKGRVPPGAVDAVLKGLDVFMDGVRATAASTPLPDLSAVLSNIAAQLLEHRSLSEHPRADAAREIAVPDATLSPESPIQPGPSPDAALPQEPLLQERVTDERGWRVQPRDILALVREVDRLREVRLRLEERRRELEVLMSDAGDASAHRVQLFALHRHLKSEIGEVGQVIEAIEERVRGLGAQPVRTILEPLRRIVRDAARSTGKLSKLSVVGEEISLDRTLLSGLRESLVHMIRNSIDHGVERPADRERAGKHREGALVLRIEQHGNLLYVEFSDDGAGLDLERLRALSVERGVVKQEQAALVDPRFLADMIFDAGLSTSASVTETSGRGVGLNAVRAWAESLGGHVGVHSVAGQGTRFEFTLPVEFGSSPLLVVRAGDQQLGVPLAAVERVVPATRDTVTQTGPKLELRYGDRKLGLRDLGAALSLREPSPPGPGQPILVIQSHGTRCALVVDGVVADLDLVIRPLPRELADIASFQGAAMTPRGELLLILRPTWLVSSATEEISASVARRALVVDDSLTARALHRAMLEAGGYVVHTVATAHQGLEWMLRGHYDVVICDLAMEGMDGFAFTDAVRTNEDLRETPIVLVSALDESSARTRGLAAGADAFLSKAECAAGRLLAEVSEVVAKRGAVT